MSYLHTSLPGAREEETMPPNCDNSGSKLGAPHENISFVPREEKEQQYTKIEETAFF